MEVQQYMFCKINDFKMNVCNPEKCLNDMASFDSEIKRMWKKDKESFDYAEIRDNARVMDYVQEFEGAVYFVENYINRGVKEDDYNMYLSLYKALKSLFKMAQNIDNIHCQFEEISIQEIDDLFNELKEVAQRMENSIMRRIMQD